MFRTAYQKGASVSVWAPQGSAPLEKWGAKSVKVAVAFNKEAKGSTLQIDSAGGQGEMKYPIESTLGLTQRYLVLQLFVPSSVSKFAMSLFIVDSTGAKQRLNFSTANPEINVTSLHTKIPCHIIRRDIWLNFVIDMASIVGAVSGGKEFQSLSTIVLHPKCSVRRIFTMSGRPFDSQDDTGEEEERVPIPKSEEFAVGVAAETQVVDYDKICLFQQALADRQADAAAEAELAGGPTPPKTPGTRAKMAFGSKAPRESAAASNSAISPPNKRAATPRRPMTSGAAAPTRVSSAGGAHVRPVKSAGPKRGATRIVSAGPRLDNGASTREYDDEEGEPEQPARGGVRDSVVGPIVLNRNPKGTPRVRYAEETTDDAGGRKPTRGLRAQAADGEEEEADDENPFMQSVVVDRYVEMGDDEGENAHDFAVANAWQGDEDADDYETIYQAPPTQSSQRRYDFDDSRDEDTNDPTSIQPFVSRDVLHPNNHPPSRGSATQASMGAPHTSIPAASGAAASHTSSNMVFRDRQRESDEMVRFGARDSDDNTPNTGPIPARGVGPAHAVLGSSGETGASRATTGTTSRSVVAPHGRVGGESSVLRDVNPPSAILSMNFNDDELALFGNDTGSMASVKQSRVAVAVGGQREPAAGNTVAAAAGGAKKGTRRSDEHEGANNAGGGGHSRKPSRAPMDAPSIFMESMDLGRENILRAGMEPQRVDSPSRARRAVTPPLVLASQASNPAHRLSEFGRKSTATPPDDGETLDLLFDPVLNCFFDPKTNAYYELV